MNSWSKEGHGAEGVTLQDLEENEWVVLDRLTIHGEGEEWRKKLEKEVSEGIPRYPPQPNAKTKTLIIVILDESSSMQPQKSEVITTYNKFLKDQKEQCKDDEVRLIFIKFNKRVTKVHDAKSLEEVPDLSHETYVPSRGTALLDAVAVGICQGEMELMKTKGNEGRVLVLIMTDGEENRSKSATRAQIKARIAEKEALGNWTFVYHGEKPDKWANNMGQSAGNSVGYVRSRLAENMEMMSDAVSNFRRNTYSQNTTRFYDF